MAKIWQLNDTLTLFGKETKVFDINFTSNNQSYIGLEFRFNDAIGQHMGYVSNSGGSVVYTEGGLRWIEGDTYKTVIFETEPDGELLTWLQANAVAQDQPAVTTTRVFYKGKKELTMAQFEALTSLDDAVDYDIIDFPNGGITNAQMTAALGYSRLFEDGEIYVCSDNGTYTKGHTYQVKVTGGVKSWEDITPASGDLQNYVPKQSEAEPVALTWRFNDVVDVNRDNNFLVNFTSNGVNFTEMGFKWSMQQSPAPKDTMYYSGPTKFQDVYYGQWSGDTAIYRTVTFETAPSGELLTWLQSNAVPQGETTKTYAQVTNENGAVSIRVFENGDADLQNLSITKDGVTINGKKPLTSVKPLFKHELEIAYSFLLPDSVEVNGSVIYHYLSNTGTQITSASEIGDNFLLSGGIGKNSANTVASQSESTALTWIINEKPDYQGEKNLSVTIPLTAGGNSYNGIQIEPSVKYPSPTCIIRVLNGEEIYSGAWFEPKFADRTLTFGTAPTGELLTWLQSNAVPQGGVDSNTVLLFNVNVTKEGSSITVEAVNASTMGYITGTVGTITDTVTQLI